MRRYPVGGTLQRRDPDAIQQIEHKIKVCLDCLTFGCLLADDTGAVRKQIEGPIRHQAGKARHRVEP